MADINLAQQQALQAQLENARYNLANAAYSSESAAALIELNSRYPSIYNSVVRAAAQQDAMADAARQAAAFSQPRSEAEMPRSAAFQAEIEKYNQQKWYSIGSSGQTFQPTGGPQHFRFENPTTAAQIAYNVALEGGNLGQGLMRTSAFEGFNPTPYVNLPQSRNIMVPVNQNVSAEPSGPATIVSTPINPEAKATSFFDTVSGWFRSAPVLGSVYQAGASFSGKAPEVANFVKTAPVLSTIYTGGQIFEGRSDVALQQDLASRIYSENVSRGNINPAGEFIGSPGDFKNLVDSGNLANTMAINQRQFEAPYLGNQVVPFTMPLANWATGASESIAKAGNAAISAGDAFLPAAAPVTHFAVGVGEGVASIVPFAALIIPASEWAVRNPAALAISVVPGTVSQGEGMVKQAFTDPALFAGNMAGMAVGGKLLGDIYSSSPVKVKYGTFDLPIERPAGLPEMQKVNLGYNKVLESVRENGIEVYNRDIAGKPATYEMQTREVPIQYYATFKGFYLDVAGQTEILGRTLSVGSPYEGKSTLFGLGFEAGRRSPTGIYFGSDAARNFGANISPTVKGAINFLGESSPEMALFKLQAAEAILPKETVGVVKAIIDTREVTQSNPGLITVKEAYGDVTPISMKPSTFSAIRQYMDANAGDMRDYGSLVGRVYTGQGGRASLGDVDTLLRSSTAQAHAENMWEIYLKGEFGEGNYNVARTETVFSTIGKSGQPKNITNVKLEATDFSGRLLSKLETVPSQITESRITGTTPTGAHALDLHPIENLKYQVEIPGTQVKTIPIEDLIWGKQTIGSPAIGTVIVNRTGAEVVVEVGGRAKDFFDTYALARVASADAYLNPKMPLSMGAKLESASDILGMKVYDVAKTEPTIAKFISEMQDPLKNAEVQLAKSNKEIATLPLRSGTPWNEQGVLFLRRGGGGRNVGDMVQLSPTELKLHREMIETDFPYERAAITNLIGDKVLGESVGTIDSVFSPYGKITREVRNSEGVVDIHTHPLESEFPSPSGADLNSWAGRRPNQGVIINDKGVVVVEPSANLPDINYERFNDRISVQNLFATKDIGQMTLVTNIDLKTGIGAVKSVFGESPIKTGRLTYPESNLFEGTPRYSSQRPATAQEILDFIEPSQRPLTLEEMNAQWRESFYKRGASEKVLQPSEVPRAREIEISPAGEISSIDKFNSDQLSLKVREEPIPSTYDYYTFKPEAIEVSDVYNYSFTAPVAASRLAYYMPSVINEPSYRPGYNIERAYNPAPYKTISSYSPSNYVPAGSYSFEDYVFGDYVVPSSYTPPGYVPPYSPPIVPYSPSPRTPPYNPPTPPYNPPHTPPPYSPPPYTPPNTPPPYGGGGGGDTPHPPSTVTLIFPKWDTTNFWKKRKPQPYNIFREILPVVTPIEELGGFRSGKSFFRAIGNQQILEVTPQRRDWLHSVDIDVNMQDIERRDSDSARQTSDMAGVSFYRAATKQEKAKTGKPILSYIPTAQEVNMAKLVGFSRKPVKRGRNPWL